MKTYSKIVRAMIALAMLSLGNYALAIPTLGFGGNINYDTIGFFPADLNLTGNLNGFEDLSVTPDLSTSSFSLFADFVSSSSAEFTTTGVFTSAGLLNDLLIQDDGGVDGATRTLLTAQVDSLQLTGPNGFNLGTLEGLINITGGLLADDFGGLGAVTSFNFNLDAVFSSTMFESNFSGNTNGDITQATVPEPMTLALLSMGLIGFGLNRKLFKR